MKELTQPLTYANSLEFCDLDFFGVCSKILVRNEKKNFFGPFDPDQNWTWAGRASQSRLKGRGSVYLVSFRRLKCLEGKMQNFISPKILFSTNIGNTLSNIEVILRLPLQVFSSCWSIENQINFGHVSQLWAFFSLHLTPRSIL